MITRFWHIPDFDLMAFIDGELHERKQARIARHLQTCSVCSARKAHLQGSLSQFMDSRTPVEDSPNLAFRVAMLRNRLKETAQSEPQGIQQQPVLGKAVTVTAIFASVVVIYMFLQQAPERGTPNAQLTPGATRVANKEEVCSVSNQERFYPIPATVAYRVFETYGIRNPEPRSYEVDYLITPALGGAEDIRNLWPQPYGAGEWNAHVKDALEDHLYNLVCSGEVALEQAQRDIATNWIAAYKQYFRTEAPLTAHRTFLKDPPWPHAMTYDK